MLIRTVCCLLINRNEEDQAANHFVYSRLELAVLSTERCFSLGATGLCDVGGPAAVRSVTVDPSDQSSSNYVVSWQTPHNGGMPIRKYLLRYRQVILLKTVRLILRAILTRYCLVCLE